MRQRETYRRYGVEGAERGYREEQGEQGERRLHGRMERDWEERLNPGERYGERDTR